MSDTNPFASPKESLAEGPVALSDFGQPTTGGLWQEGSLLVMHRMAQLPDRCVKTNLPANGRRLKRQLHWHNPLIYLTLLISPLIYIILAVIVTKRATIHIGLSEERAARRRKTILIAWGLVLLSVVLFIGGIVLIQDYDAAGFIILAGVLLFLGAAIHGLVAARMVAPTRITGDHIWLKGVHPDFLAGLPPLPEGY